MVHSGKSPTPSDHHEQDESLPLFLLPGQRTRGLLSLSQPTCLLEFRPAASATGSGMGPPPAGQALASSTSAPAEHGS